MKQKILSGLLAAVLVLSLSPAALALDLTDDKSTALAALGIMAGDENGNLNLSSSINRAEFVTMAVRAHSTGRYTTVSGSTSPYYDVPASHWASGYITTATQLGLVTGYLDGLFHPERTITLEEGVTVVLQLLGYSTADFPGGWPASQMTAYRSLGLDKGMTAVQGQPLTRKDAQQLFYNLLTTRNKQGTYYLNALEPGLQAVDANGTVHVTTLINDAVVGPEVAGSNWRSQLPFAVNGNTSLYRNGVKVSAAAIQTQDVLYWSGNLRTVWAYSTKVTGTYTAASPSISSPTAVTVAGKTYTVSGAAAQLALSDVGGAKLGDTVTLLLGRDDAVAAVISGSAAADSNLAGVVTAVGSGTYYDTNGSAYTAPTVTFIATDGSSYTYPVASSAGYKAGDLVQVTVSGNTAKVSKLSTGSVTGRVSADGSSLNGTAFADDVQILDVYQSSALRIYPERLAGVSLTDGDVKYYSKNAAGEIDRLILNDVTGDLFQYGILTGIQDYSAGMSINVIYTYLIGDQTVTYPSQGTSFAVSSTGPVQIRGTGAVEKMTSLTSVRLTSVSGNTARSNSQTYTLADNAAVYTFVDGKYYAADLSYVTGGDYTLTGYYDNPMADGGRIRIIIAR